MDTVKCFHFQPKFFFIELNMSNHGYTFVSSNDLALHSGGPSRADTRVLATSGSLGQDPRCKCYCNDSTTDKKLAAPKVPILGWINVLIPRVCWDWNPSSLKGKFVTCHTRIIVSWSSWWYHTVTQWSRHRRNHDANGIRCILPLDICYRICELQVFPLQRPPIGGLKSRTKTSYH